MAKVGSFLFAGFLAIGAASAPTAGAAERQKQADAAYPSKPIRIISPLAPGGSADAITRMVGEALADAWYGLLAPRGTPGRIVAKLWATVAGSLEASKMREKLLAQGVEPVGSTQKEFRAFLKAEIVRWTRVVKEAGVKAD